jgi:hypothetical protein
LSILTVIKKYNYSSETTFTISLFEVFRTSLLIDKTKEIIEMQSIKRASSAKDHLKPFTNIEIPPKSGGPTNIPKYLL